MHMHPASGRDIPRNALPTWSGGSPMPSENNNVRSESASKQPLCGHVLSFFLTFCLTPPPLVSIVACLLWFVGCQLAVCKNLRCINILYDLPRLIFIQASKVKSQKVVVSRCHKGAMQAAVYGGIKCDNMTFAPTPAPCLSLDHDQRMSSCVDTNIHKS